LKKRKWWTALIVLAVAAVSLGAIVLSQWPRKMDIGYVDVATLENGVYEGRCDNGLVAAAVQVTVEGGKIMDIILTEHQYGMGQPAEAILDKIIQRQSIQVDVVAGATYSSNVIQKAIENALLIKEC